MIMHDNTDKNEAIKDLLKNGMILYDIPREFTIMIIVIICIDFSTPFF